MQERQGSLSLFGTWDNVPMTAADRVAFTVVGPTVTFTISAAEHAHWAEIAHRSGASRREARWQAFEQLVQFTWLEAEAAERGLVLSDEVVQRELLATWRDAFPDGSAFQRFLHETGQTAADFERRVRQDLLSEAIRENVMAGVAASVTDAMVEDFIAEHGLEQVPERRDVRLVLTERNATALTAKRELLSGTSWESVVARYSIDESTRHRAGERLRVARGKLEPRLARAIFRAPCGEIKGPVRTRSGFWVFSVERIEPPHPRSLAPSRRIVRRRLVKRAEQAALDRFVAAYSEKWRRARPAQKNIARVLSAEGGPSRRPGDAVPATTADDRESGRLHVQPACSRGSSEAGLSVTLKTPCDRVRRVGVAGGRQRRPGRAKRFDSLRRWRDRRYPRRRRRPAGVSTSRGRSAGRARLLGRARADQRPHSRGDDAVPRPRR
jgi:parvulin-like peptidyl-prolyl isomerase